jgi:hypothetical protein
MRQHFLQQVFPASRDADCAIGGAASLRNGNRKDVPMESEASHTLQTFSELDTPWRTDHCQITTKLCEWPSNFLHAMTRSQLNLSQKIEVTIAIRQTVARGFRPERALLGPKQSERGRKSSWLNGLPDSSIHSETNCHLSLCDASVREGSAIKSPPIASRAMSHGPK